MHRQPKSFRSLFLSDIHLGNPGCQAAMLLEFLRNHVARTLYLVGDIVDVENLARRFFRPQTHNDVLRAMLDQARQGARIVYVPGNHDIQARAYCGLTFGRIEIRRQVLHTTAAGKRYLVMHGDEFDRHIDRHAWLHQIGALTYRQLVRINSGVNGWRERAGLGYWPIASVIKQRSRSARRYLEHFRASAMSFAEERQVNGCIVGHIHRPEILCRDGIDYLNCGDWVEHCSALAEHADGRMELPDWPTMQTNYPAGANRALPRAA